MSSIKKNESKKRGAIVDLSYQISAIPGVNFCPDSLPFHTSASEASVRLLSDGDVLEDVPGAYRNASCQDTKVKTSEDHVDSNPNPDLGPVPPAPSLLSPPSPGPHPQPYHPIPSTRPPTPQLLGAVYFCYCLLGGGASSSAQLASSAFPPQPQQAPAVVSPVPSMGAPPTSGISARITTPTTTNRLTSSSRPFSGAGHGLPGMTGGPPLTSSVGARDPAPQFMRPATIGPLFCDPAVDFSC